MKDRMKAADVEKALQHWTGSVIEPQLKPVQAKARQLGETALSLASSLEGRCREFIRNTKYDMSGLGDSRRLRAAMALNRVSGEIVTASSEFLKSSPNESYRNWRRALRDCYERLVQATTNRQKRWLHTTLQREDGSEQ